MMEYIFFDADLRDRFVEYARSLGVTCVLQEDNMGLVVAVPEDLADDLVDSLEMHYDQLQEEQSSLMDQSEGGSKKLAGFRLDLPGGQSCIVPLQPDMANRLFACFSFEEIHVLFDAVARSVLNPDDNSQLCKIMKAGGQIDTR
jgi:hypothetical protein